MSAAAAQGVVERASAELSRRITGLALRGRRRSPGVVERVASALCGPGAGPAAGPGGGAASVGPGAGPVSGTPPVARVPRRRRPVPRPLLWHQLVFDDRFLEKFFLYFTPMERRVLAQVCTRWRDVLYASGRWWGGLRLAVQCRELRAAGGAGDAVGAGGAGSTERALYASLVRRGMRSLALVGADDGDARALVASFPGGARHVTALSLRACPLSDAGLEALLDHLQAVCELELAGCNEVSEAGLWASLSPRVVRLALADCINVADEAVGAVAQLLPALCEFSLQAYHVTDAALGYFSASQSASLSALRLHSCWELTNHGVVNIVHALPNLTELSLSGCSKVSDEGVELLAENLPRLRRLDLGWCPRLTDTALEYIACDLVALQDLTLDRCVHITDIGVGYLATMSSLVALSLRWCCQLRDPSAASLASLRNLRALSLAGCPLLTSGGLSSLIQLRALRELELTNCPGASRELLDYLRDHLPACLVLE